MKKILHITANMLLILSLCGCASPNYGSTAEASDSGATLGKQVFIDEVEVSGMTVEQAIQALEPAQAIRLKGITYTVAAPQGAVAFTADALPIEFNTHEVLLEALSTPTYARGVYFTTPCANLEGLRGALTRLTQELCSPAQNAQALYDKQAAGLFTFEPAAEGAQIDVPALALELQALIPQAQSARLEARSVPISPSYTDEMARADSQLIAEFSTSFASGGNSKKERVFNISKAAGLIDGARLAPGEEFDANAALGDRNAENGWKIAAGIRDGGYVQEYGGGVCQVSSTLYNAVLMADLEVTERWHHSWPLAYISAGRDATISTGGPNFRFINTKDIPIVLSTHVDTKAKTITIRIYGRPPQDGSTIRITSKKTGRLEDLGTEYVVDKSLAPGQTEEVRKSRRGCTAITYKEYYDASGKALRREVVSEDKYRSIRGLVKVAP
ncbi:MAG: VanW family protein [Christensenellaceae bacterium]|jgi:vancomycin resistance protein YoaR|nr:VanW family protein [Christensenellaceae bacterium]